MSQQNPLIIDSDIADIAIWMEKLCPNREDRQLVMGQLAQSIRYAKTISNDVCALTQFESGFRLNVGPVEVMTFAKLHEAGSWPYLPERAEEVLLEIRLLLYGEIPISVKTYLDAMEAGYDMQPAAYKSVPQPQFDYTNLVDIASGKISEQERTDLQTALTLLQPLHQAFINHATKTSTGAIRKTSSFHRSHSEALLKYAENFANIVEAPAIDTFATEVIEPEDAELLPMMEGAAYSVVSTKYERNAVARKACLAHHGLNCCVCNFSFAKTYGDAAPRYIHVHHLKPIATIGESYEIDPIKDLRPVCANCHAVIHLRQPPYSIEEMQVFLQN